jgi:hypothetical protein
VIDDVEELCACLVFNSLVFSNGWAGRGPMD